MHKELLELQDVLIALGYSKNTKNNTKAFLENICKKVSDNYMNSKYDYYINNKEECIHLFCLYSKEISERCKKNICQDCPLNKWCNKYREEAQLNEEIRKGYTFADFFCGAGGLSLGFEQEGFKLCLANDIQECCIDTYSFNHPEVPKKNIVAGDINDVISRIDELKRYNDVDVVIGGPPCQGFSMANRQRIIDDPRNHLYKSFVQAVHKLNPKFVVMENVRGMLKVSDQVIEDFNRIGYKVSVRLLNAYDYGVPQQRERAIFIGNNIGINNDVIFEQMLFESMSIPKHNLNDAITGMPKLYAKTVKNNTGLENDKSGYTISKNNMLDNEYSKLINGVVKTELLFNHKARYNNPRDIEIFSRLNPGDNSADPKIADIMPYKRREKIFKDKYYKLENDKPCKTITAHMKYDCNMYIHPLQARGLTPREAARIQSYPDYYYFRGAYTKTYMQVGNSVPPLLSRVIARIIKAKLDEVE